jgi:glycosyltransferase involved in cell wall biosynthesis
MNPRISIVTVVLNRRQELAGTLQSVLDQDYENIEYIVQDGGSTDGTIELVRSLGEKISVFRSEKDKGIYDAMNKATKHVTGSWVIYMNAGDRFYSNSVLSNIFAGQIHDADIVYGEALMQYRNYQVPFGRAPLTSIWKKSPFSHQAAFIRGELMKAMGYDTTYKIGADHDLFYRAYKAGKKFKYVNQVVCLFDAEDGATKKHIFQAIKDKMNIAMKLEPGTDKWLYYQGFLLYAHVSLTAKALLGKGFIDRIRKLLRSSG